MNRIEMDEEYWYNFYRPIKNKFGEYLFETDHEVVRSTDPHYVWTLVEGDDNSLIICSGYAFVNRLGYYITQIPWANGESIDIILDEGYDDDTEEEEEEE